MYLSFHRVPTNYEQKGSPSKADFSKSFFRKIKTRAGLAPVICNLEEKFMERELHLLYNPTLRNGPWI